MNLQYVLCTVHVNCCLISADQLKDTHGHQYTVRNICAKFTTPNSEPVPDTKLRIDLGNCVKCQSSEAVERSGDTPWYQKYRNTFLDHLKQSDYECIKHYVCGELK